MLGPLGMKVMGGALAFVIIALALTGGLLLRATEDVGRAEQAVTEAASKNQRMKRANSVLEASNQQLLADIERERQAREAAAATLQAVRQQYDADMTAFNRRYQDAITGLDAEQSRCLTEYIPQPLIDSLHIATGHH